jgi:integrase
MARRFLRLTREAVRVLKPGQHITERGIKAEAEPDGDVRWSVDVQVRGLNIHRVIGRASDGITRSDAEAFIEKHRSDARAGQLALPAGRKLPQLIDELGRLYLDQLLATGGKDYVNAEQHWRLHVLPFFAGKRFGDITPLDVEQFRYWLQSRGLAEGTVHLVLASWRRMGRKLAVWGTIPQPLPTIPLPIPKNARERVLSKGEAQALLHAAQYDPNPDIHLFIRLGLGTSLRHSEILSARWENFDPERRRLRVRVKGGSWRLQPLPPTIVALLLAHRGEPPGRDGWIFPSSHADPGHRTSMRAPFARCAIIAGLDPAAVVPHTLRHTAITWLASRAVDLKTLQAFSGHRSVAMILRYAHAQDAAIDAALVRFDAPAESAGQVVALHDSAQSPQRLSKISNQGSD